MEVRRLDEGRPLGPDRPGRTAAVSSSARTVCCAMVGSRLQLSTSSRFARSAGSRRADGATTVMSSALECKLRWTPRVARMLAHAPRSFCAGFSSCSRCIALFTEQAAGFVRDSFSRTAESAAPRNFRALQVNRFCFVGFPSGSPSDNAAIHREEPRAVRLDRTSRKRNQHPRTGDTARKERQCDSRHNLDSGICTKRTLYGKR